MQEPFFVALPSILWAGMIIGVSGLATPVKFTAPSLSLPVALDVGRVTYRLFCRIEWALAIVVITASLVIGASPLELALLCLAALCLILQAVWLMPRLDARLAAVVRGEALPRSRLHIWYMALEIAKLALLLTLGVVTI